MIKEFGRDPGRFLVDFLVDFEIAKLFVVRILLITALPKSTKNRKKIGKKSTQKSNDRKFDFPKIKIKSIGARNRKTYGGSISRKSK